VSRFLYWTILIGDEPTSFRAAEAAELKPTLVQLQRTNPEARLVWFERGRIWGSPAEAHAARLGDRATAKSRPSTWRPGGKHVDPRQKYKDAKKAKWTRFKEGIRARSEGRYSDRPPPVREDGPKRSTKEILADWKPPPAADRKDNSATDRRENRPTDRKDHGATDRRRQTQTRDREWRPKAEGDRPQSRGPWQPKRETLRQDSRRPWGSKPEGERPAPRKPWGAQPDGERPPRKPWGAKPEGARPDRPKFGSKPGGKFARPKFDGPRAPRPRTRDDRGPRKPRKD
jgi:hypothetical protein